MVAGLVGEALHDYEPYGVAHLSHSRCVSLAEALTQAQDRVRGADSPAGIVPGQPPPRAPGLGSIPIHDPYAEFRAEFLLRRNELVSFLGTLRAWLRGPIREECGITIFGM